MAVLSFSIVLTLICVSILTKLSARYSFGRSLLSSGLFRYLHPSTEVLKTAAGRAPLKGGGARKRNRDGDTEVSEGFPVPKEAYIDLETAQVNSIDVLQLPFYVEFRWLMDYSICALLVYCISEFYNWLLPLQADTEINLSIVWCLVALFLAMKCLVSLSALYFRESSDTGERSLCLCIGCVYFLFAMIFMMFSDRVLDLNLRNAYNNFTSISNTFLQQQQLNISAGERSPIFLYLILSILLGLLAGMLVFPCFRYSRMYLAALDYAQERPFVRILLHSSFLCPMFVLFLWIRLFANDQLTDTADALLTVDQLDSVRLWCVVLMVLLRLLTMRLCLQAYLNGAREKLNRWNKETGRINSLEIQRSVARTFMYLCNVSLQYVIPLVILLFLTFMLKTKGGFYWLTPFGFPPSPIAFLTFKSTSGWIDVKEINRSLVNIYYLFNTTVSRGIWSFLLVSFCLLTTSLNLIGVVYEKQFGEK